ncbi:MAG TPA: hypothetical protein EYP60_08670 [bacterium (Candidatus Stahlbacteria)]|nr:hypothetical protein [Candidatus Stahlbacteria bacterium]
MNKNGIFQVFVLIIFLFTVRGCRDETEWWSRIEFVDSTYMHGTSEYYIGVTVYLLFTGECPHDDVPETLHVEVFSNLGDYETIGLVRFLNGGIDTLENPRIGRIKTEGDTGYVKGNDTLEVNPFRDTIFVFSGNKTFPGKDTAYITRGGGR